MIALSVRCPCGGTLRISPPPSNPRRTREGQHMKATQEIASSQVSTGCSRTSQFGFVGNGPSSMFPLRSRRRAALAGHAGVWALGGCCRLCRFPAVRVIGPLAILSCVVWCVGAPPPQARGGLVCVWRWQQHFLHDGPSGMCRAMCRRGSFSTLHRRMMDTCFSTNLSRRCDFAIWFLQNYFLVYCFATFWKSEKNFFCYCFATSFFLQNRPAPPLASLKSCCTM